MKSCPTCQRTFEDTLTFCLIDGAVLSAPFDLHATRRNPEGRSTNPPATEVLRQKDSPKPQVLPSTVQSPLPTLPAFGTPQPFVAAAAAKRSNQLPWGRLVLKGAVTGMAVGLGMIVIISLVLHISELAWPIFILTTLLGAVLQPVAQVIQRRKKL